MKKILITGAHFTTALAVIDELEKEKGIEIVYVGRKTTREGDSSPSVESQVLPGRGVKFIPIITGRLQKSFTIYTIPSLLKIPIGLIQSFFILVKERPNVVLSFGGYVSVPVVISAWLLSIPVIIHEQTLVSGLANKIGSIFASKIAVSFDGENEFSKEKVILTGNPLRKEILGNGKVNLPEKYDELFKEVIKNKLPIVLITGGNQGSHSLNLAVEGCLERLLKVACVIHQTGDSKFKDFERLEERFGNNKRYLVGKFIFDEWFYVLKRVDLAVARTGINTLTEFAYLGLPTLGVPLPYLYKDEQNKNAKFFEKLGLVKILSQSKLTANSLFDQVSSMLKDLPELKKEAKNAEKVIIKDAAKRLALETLLLAK